MNFSKSFLDTIRANTSLADLIGEKVTWDQKKTKASQGNFWCSCPFHQEKTASFHVDSSKGFYYCFGCHAKGDCFTFLKDHERLSFHEAVRYLAQKANINLPKNSLKEEKQNELETELLRIHEESSKFFTEQLLKSSSKKCLDYLNWRGIDLVSRNHFEIGYASNSRNDLYKHLIQKKFSPKTILESGLCMVSSKGGDPFDRFRDRVMFPIKDSRNKTIAFGGRSLDANSPAKYINSPETALFSKGKVLYNFGNARSAERSETPLLLVEGYMDVVALFKAGFPRTVAPLGTATTEEQLQLLWRLDTEPIVFFDGDRAGQAAANKFLSLALPLLEARRSVRFAQLPNNQDPDDFLKLEGEESFRNLVKTALPAITLLWRNLTDGKVFDSPERKAGLDLTLNDYTAKIKNPLLRAHFATTLKQLKKNFFSGFDKNLNVKNTDPSKNFRNKNNRESYLNETKNSFLGRARGATKLELKLKEGIILLGCLNHPTIASKFENELSRLSISDPDLKKIRDVMLSELPVTENEAYDLFHKKINTQLKFDALDKLNKIPQLKIHPHVGPLALTSNVTEAIDDSINQHNSITNFRREIKLAEKEFIKGSSEDTTNRIYAANKTLQRAVKGKKTSNLMGEDITKASKKRLNAMIENKIWLKKK